MRDAIGLKLRVSPPIVQAHKRDGYVDNAVSNYLPSLPERPD